MKKKYNKGQSTIEFIITFTAAIGFIFLFLKMALNYTNGYMVHHATFMASRAYLVGDAELYQSPAAGDISAFNAAESVFKKNLPEALIQGFDGKLEVHHPDTGILSVFTGVWIKFSQPFSLGFVGGKDPVLFQSESFLGREPTRAEAYFQICTAIKTISIESSLSSCDVHVTLDDNGG
jgi:hypothetical protein